MIEIANRSNLADSFCSGIIQIRGTGLFKTPAYYAQQLYALHAGSRPLKILVDTEVPSDPSLDTSATLSEDGRETHPFRRKPTGESQSRTVDLAALAPMDQDVHVWTLATRMRAGERDAAITGVIPTVSAWNQTMPRLKVRYSHTVFYRCP